ncbi:hypothetical protein ACH4UM_19540 [Streptomyces sp. NPDC020801]|uniref:hypothetical protein n=1 Tax=unclassified Streptomyces TaxID=2593676 RepID=UPI0037A83284
MVRSGPGCRRLPSDRLWSQRRQLAVGLDTAAPFRRSEHRDAVGQHYRHGWVSGFAVHIAAGNSTAPDTVTWGPQSASLFVLRVSVAAYPAQ